MRVYYEIGSYLPQFHTSNLPHISPDMYPPIFMSFMSSWCCHMLMGIELPTGAHSEKRKEKKRDGGGGGETQRQSDGERREKEKEKEKNDSLFPSNSLPTALR